MSYYGNGRGGGRRRYRERDEHEERRPPVESPDEKLKNAILKLGEVDPVEELTRLEKYIRENVPQNVQVLSEAFRIGVTEQPYKTPFYAALIYLLHNPSENADAGEPSLGRLVLEDFWKGFQSYVDKVAWTETRLCMQFFAHLTVAGLVSADSMLALVKSFTAVLDEFGASYGRGKKAALCAGEALIIAGSTLKSASTSGVDEVISAIRTFAESSQNANWLVSPISLAHAHSVPLEHVAELVGMLLSTLSSLNESDFSETANCIPQPYLNFPSIDSAITNPYTLPLVLVPPEAMEIEGISSEAGEDPAVKREDWPEFHLRLFPSDVVPEPDSLAGYVTQTALLDIVRIFEVNRKECARLLLEYPKWTIPGTFKPKPGAAEVLEPVTGKDWQLESTIIEAVLSAYMVLPEAEHKSIYYIALITELCKLSPSTVGPAVGKSIRKLYSLLSDGLDSEASRRFAEWFAVHMSNFGFQWVWKEWLPDLSLPNRHPRRAFMRRAVEFEIRLAYHDRILKTLPEPMQDPEAMVIPEQGSSAAYDYEDPSNPHYDTAQVVLNLLRGRAKAEDVIAQLETLRGSLESSEDDVDSLLRHIVVQSLLHIGSRSFSHFLNAIERYLPLLRKLAGVGQTVPDPRAKADILKASANLWKNNRQMVGIVFDKLMQYQIVEPSDVVSWTFVNGAAVGDPQEVEGAMNMSAFEWDLLRAAIDKSNGRVVIAKRKIAMLRKENDDERARAKAGAGENMEVDAEGKDLEGPAVDNPALTTALKAYSSLVKEQKGTLSKALEGFVNCIAPSSGGSANPRTKDVITEAAWHNRVNWEREEWQAWETWSWYKHFARTYAPYLRTYAKTLEAISFSKFEGDNSAAAAYLRRIWDIATGQDS